MQSVSSHSGMQRVLCTVLLCAAAVHAARILAVLPTNTKSHYAMYGRIIDALVKRDHHLTVITHFPSKHPPSNMEQISLEGTIPEITNNLTKQQPTIKPNFVRNLEQIIKECLHACEVVSQMPGVISLLNSTEKFDLIIIEVFGSECFLPFGKRFDAPVVGLLSSVPLPWVNDQIANPEGPSYIPAYVTGYGQKMNIFERFLNTIAINWAKIIYRYKSQAASQAIADRMFGPGDKLETLAQNYSLILSNSHFSINEVRPLVPALVEVGGLHLNDAQAMPKNLQNILDNSNEGVVYWSFGSMSRIETIPSDKLAQIFHVMSQLPQIFLVKMNRALLSSNLTVPENVFTMDWIPQYKTLCHPNVKVFISHGGLLGTQEAVACGVPMLILPLYADQALNARAMKDRGLSLTLTLQEITKDTLKEALQNLLSDHRFKENALKIRERFLDRPMPPLETSVYWIEYVLRHKGASHLRSPALDLSLTQYLLLDVLIICVTLTAMTTYILYKLFRYLCTRCIRWWPKQAMAQKTLFRKSITILHTFMWVYKIKTN
ncbi:UDP-glucosyltransferase 2-like [Zerene cesonia]|uniref:UDP-glucosyltransferase 2-like n=1 Tax=Zerene cesonia TaxID=33412 RepID=UPI0018E55BB4|nr:UDP-glucosyltransferase 2-like [Zerene cesonia]